MTSEEGQEGKAAVGNLLDLESELAFIQEVRETNKLQVAKLLKYSFSLENLVRICIRRTYHLPSVDMKLSPLTAKNKFCLKV